MYDPLRATVVTRREPDDIRLTEEDHMQVEVQRRGKNFVVYVHVNGVTMSRYLIPSTKFSVKGPAGTFVEVA